MKQILSALFFAGLMLLVSYVFRHPENFGLTIEGGLERQSGVIIGIMLVWFGNVMPKLGPNSCECGNNNKSLNMRRFAGVMLVLGGALHTLAWIFAPLEQANVMAMIAVGGSLTIIIVRAITTRTFV